MFNADKFNKIVDSILVMQKYYRDYGFSGSGSSGRGLWKDNIIYHIGDNVSYDNVLWQAKEDNINSKPHENNTDWLKVLSPPDLKSGLTWGQLAGKG